MATDFFQNSIHKISRCFYRIRPARVSTVAPGNIASKITSQASPSGYPSFVSFLSSHSSFHILRRFTSLRLRLLLYKQNQLCDLERQLDEVDRSETNLLFLGSISKDENPNRRRILEAVDVGLAEFDALVDRNERALSRRDPRSRDTSNIQGWLADKASIARKETEYIDQAKDIMSLENRSGDSALEFISLMVEKLLILLPSRFRSKLQVSGVSEPQLWIFPKGLLRALGRVLLAGILIALLLVPVALINDTKNLHTRLALIWISATLFILVLTVATKAKTSEVFVAGTTYATVLVVFLAQDGIA